MLQIILGQPEKYGTELILLNTHPPKKGKHNLHIEDLCLHMRDIYSWINGECLDTMNM
jgi:hypothetical protein